MDLGALSFGSDSGSASDERGEPGGRLPRGAALARATAIEIAILAGHLLLYPTGVLQERVEEHAQRDRARDQTTPLLPTEGRTHPPVLLLHGFVDNRSVFTLLRRSLRRHGWQYIQALNYSPLTCDIRTAAALLEQHIERVCEQTGHRQVDIVGHSLGGLISRYYVQRLGGDARVRTVVTLGTPHSGTRAVPLLTPHPVIRQMRPHSTLMSELDQPAPGCRTHFVAFWSDMDQLMVPIETARLDHPDLLARNIHVSGVGHLTMPVHGVVTSGIRQALTGEETPPGAADAA